MNTDNNKLKIEKVDYGVFFKKYEQEFDFYLERFGIEELLMKYDSIINEFKTLKKKINEIIDDNTKKFEITNDFLLNDVKLSIKISTTNKQQTNENSYIGNSMYIHKDYKNKISKDMCFSGLCIDSRDLKETVLYHRLKERYGDKLLYFLIPNNSLKKNTDDLGEFIFEHKIYKNKKDFICLDEDDKKTNFCIKIEEGLTYKKNNYYISKIFSLKYLLFEYKNTNAAIMYGFPHIDCSKYKHKRMLFSIRYPHHCHFVLYEKDGNKYSMNGVVGFIQD